MTSNGQQKAKRVQHLIRGTVYFDTLIFFNESVKL